MRKNQILVTSPTYTLKILKDFTLKNLENVFIIADFERQISKKHVNKILESMTRNEFFDNIISVVLKRNGLYEVIDGQHRITALGRLRNEHSITKYNLVLMIFQEKYSRKIFRQINLAKPLKMQDHLRALDNGKNLFFEMLRPHFVHYNDGRLPKFEMILNALSYAKNGSPRAVNPYFLERMFKNITEKDLKVIMSFSKAIRKVEPFTPKQLQKIYTSSVYRNMFRVGYENKFDQGKWEDFIAICKADKTIDKLQDMRTIASIKEMYNHMIKHVGKQVGLKLEKVERTNVETRQVLENPSNAAI